MASSPLIELPPELRVRIYEYILSAGRPLKALKNPRRELFFAIEDETPTKAKQPLQGVVILSVNRLISKEALDVLYKVTIFSVPKARFCLREARSTTATLRLEAVVKLHISTLAIFHECLKELEGMLTTMPRLKTVTLERGSNREDGNVFDKFESVVKSCADDETSPVHSDAGQRYLKGRAAESVEISFKHAELVVS